MKKLFLILLVILTAGELRSEYLFLTDGSIIKCTVLTEVVEEVTVLDDNKTVQRYPRAKVMRILYTELNMGKIYVRLKNGEFLLVYQVDEDRTTYTFRREIDKPEEFKIERSEVLFVAERNPSSLKGEAGTDRINLSWYRPYDPMQEYRIYWKKSREDKYDLAATISGTVEKYTIEKLPSNTTYFFIITGVDKFKEETLPSNQLEITTKNIPPVKPAGMRVIRGSDSALIVTWDPAIDPDGSVREYRVYKKDDGSDFIIGKTPVCSLELPRNLNSFSIAVRSVDDRGGESENGNLRGLDYLADFLPAVMYPLGSFSSMFSTGYGAYVSMTASDNFFMFSNITAAIDFGYYYFPGKHVHVKDMQMVPAVISAGYRYRFSGRLSVTPAAGAGAVFMKTAYESRGDSGTDVLSGRSSSGMDFMVRFSVRGDYLLYPGISLIAGLHYGMLVESGGPLHFISLTAGAGAVF